MMKRMQTMMMMMMMKRKRKTPALVFFGGQRERPKKRESRVVLLEKKVPNPTLQVNSHPRKGTMSPKSRRQFCASPGSVDSSHRRSLRREGRGRQRRKGQ